MAIVPNNHAYFFIHIMKTGGTSFIGRCRQNFYPHEILGGEDEDKPWLSDPSQFLDARRMKEIVAARRFRLRLLYGHVPPAAAPAVTPRAKTITILRHPVQRVVSALRHAALRFPEHRGLCLEEIYEDPWFRPRLFVNHQLKLFAMTEEEALGPGVGCRGPSPAPDRSDVRPCAAALDGDEEAMAEYYLAAAGARSARELFEHHGSQFLTPIDLDDARFELALQRLATIDVFGFQDAQDELLELLTDRWGWKFWEVEKANVTASADLPAPPALRRRIASDSEAGIEFFHKARRRYQRRLRRTILTP